MADLPEDIKINLDYANYRLEGNKKEIIGNLITLNQILSKNQEERTGYHLEVFSSGNHDVIHGKGSDEHKIYTRFTGYKTFIEPNGKPSESADLGEAEISYNTIESKK